MTRMGTELLNGLLSLAAREPKPAAGVDMVEAGVFEKYLHRAREADPASQQSPASDRRAERRAVAADEGRDEGRVAADSRSEDTRPAHPSSDDVAAGEQDAAATDPVATSNDPRDESAVPSKATEPAVDEGQVAAELDDEPQQPVLDLATIVATAPAAAVVPLVTPPAIETVEAVTDRTAAVEEVEGEAPALPLPPAGQPSLGVKPTEAAQGAEFAAKTQISQDQSQQQSAAEGELIGAEPSTAETMPEPGGQVEASRTLSQPNASGERERGGGQPEPFTKGDAAAPDPAAVQPVPANNTSHVAATATATADAAIAAAEARPTAAPQGDTAGNSTAASRSGEVQATTDSASKQQRNADATQKASNAHNASGLTQAERARLTQRVARAMEALGERGGSIRLRLHPPELGALKLEVTVRDGAMNARLEAETPAAQTALMENLPLLRERLAEHNIRVDRFEVDLAGRSAGGASDRPGGESNGGDHRGGRHPSERRFASAEPQPTASRRAVGRSGEGSRLDILI